MTQVLRSPSNLPSSPRPSLSCDPNDNSNTHLRGDPFGGEEDPVGEVEWKRERRGGEEGEAVEKRRRKELQVPPLLALLLTALRRSLLRCKTEEEGEEGGGGGRAELRSMEIGWPTEVRHVTHVTFDRFHGFLGLPVEFEPEVPSRAPSASASVFGVSTESMQCSYDSRGNSVPTILLLMQRRLYEQGGLRAEGIFRINADNCQQEYLRDQLNSGIVPDGVDVHSLAGLIKAWFRELPTGVLDSLSPEQVMQCQSEEDCAQLVRLLPPTEAALLDWALNLMADVVQEEQQNKMNARNVAMVFAPNMTQMADPLTALMYAVQVMNFLKMLILKTLKGRQQSTLQDGPNPHLDSYDENGDRSPRFHLESGGQEATEPISDPEPYLDCPARLSERNVTTDDVADSSQTSRTTAAPKRTARHSTGELLFEIPARTDRSTNGQQTSANGSNAIHVNSRRIKIGRTGSMNHCKGARKARGQSAARATLSAGKSRGISIVSHIDSKAERVEAWR